MTETPQNPSGESPTINRSLVVRLYPNREQSHALRSWHGSLRFAWNATWTWCQQQRTETGKWPKKTAIWAHVVAMKKAEGTRWLAELPAHALLKLAEDLHQAISNWLNKRTRMPKFRGKHRRQCSVYAVNQSTE